MLLNSSDPNISTVLDRIKKNRLDLQPNFQRGEVWGLAKKQRLIDTILRGWHIPPIHVIDVFGSNKAEVLDGQQRLAAIRDFVADKFTFNAKFDPIFDKFQELDGLKYSEFSEDAQGIIDDFTLRVISISNYEPGEPAELFYRLNQPTNLTSAEQRNAYFGIARQQVKDLSEIMENLGYCNATIGFANSRMAYDDVLAKLLLTLEFSNLDNKISSNLVTQRYRDTHGFCNENYILVQESLNILMKAIETHLGKAKLNKSTLYSWLFFISVYLKSDFFEIDKFIGCFTAFETSKYDNFTFHSTVQVSNKFIHNLIKIYMDRASSRVADISSVKLRDIVLWGVFLITYDFKNTIPNCQRIQLKRSLISISGEESNNLEQKLNEIIKSIQWGSDYDFI